ncbi:hypothetical protein AAU61_03495 [Desulfocarbo indianensis]|nr:hypothetical protein AAU61_03495 [Desulfocarbo indianensis]
MAARKLRTGFTTGTAAAAAAKAALLTLWGQAPARVMVTLPGGGTLGVEVERTENLAPGRARAAVIKDAGDDPDATHRALILAEVELMETGNRANIVILGGEGVGVVTRPGLDLPVGQPAINPTPRDMIRAAIAEAWQQAGPPGSQPQARVTISVPQGRRLAQKTLNPRLGIEGGISILGTTGLVKPFSHEAYIATIDSGLKVAAASGAREVVLTTGRRSEKKAMALRPDLPELAFIQMADFFLHAMEKAAGMGFAQIGLVSFFGKAVKQAQAHSCTHAHRVPMDLSRLAEWLDQAGAGGELTQAVAGANTARHALEEMRAAGRLDLVPQVGRRLLAAMRGFAGPGPGLWAVVMDYDGSALFQGRLAEGAPS